MEKPDSEGYINVTWPSKNVPHGGIFHTRTAEISGEKQQFLKLLVEESRLNLKLRQSRAFGLRAGDADSQSGRGGTAVQVRTPVARPHTSRRRSLSAIRSSGILDVDTYRPPKRGEDRERLKQELANAMAFGDNPELPPPAPRSRTKPTPKLPTAKEKWNELVTQIRERAEWLAEMEWLGEGAPHREIVQDQIAERMRALDALGVDSACSSARSTICSTGRSPAQQTFRSLAQPTVRSPAQPPVRSPGIESRPEVPSVRSSASLKGKKDTKISSSTRRSKIPVEDVSAYNQLPPLAYSPRRRV